MRRLYLQIYLSFVGILVLLGLLEGLAWFLMPEAPHERQLYEGVGKVLTEVLPGPERPREELQATLERLSSIFPARFTVHSAEGKLLAAVGDPLPAPRREQSGWMHFGGTRGLTVAVHLPDGRWLIALHEHVLDKGHVFFFFLVVGLLALSIAIGAYPLARRIAGRLERLQERVDELGEGELSARVEVEGNDEVAELAHSFNRAAARIEQLVEAQRGLLASASHELRSPLARMRVAVELLGDERPELRDQVARDIAELDELIEELLLASRLETIDQLERLEEVDLLALLAEEAARLGAEVGGEPVRIQGDARMLRRLMRNLLENARRYGAGSEIEASLVPQGGEGALLRIADRGPGVPEDERERIFEPFYRPSGMRETGEGVGLGLALVRQIARHHGGDACCLPREGGGTCFEVTLFAADSAQQ